MGWQIVREGWRRLSGSDTRCRCVPSHLRMVRRCMIAPPLTTLHCTALHALHCNDATTQRGPFCSLAHPPTAGWRETPPLPEANAPPSGLRLSEPAKKGPVKRGHRTFPLASVVDWQDKSRHAAHCTLYSG